MLIMLLQYIIRKVLQEVARPRVLTYPVVTV